MNASMTFRPATSLSNYHDFDYEKFAAKEAALDSFNEDWTADLVSDERAGSFGKIDSIMNEVMETVCCDDRKCAALNRALFALWSGGSDCVRQIRELLETEMTAVMKDEFLHGTDR